MLSPHNHPVIAIGLFLFGGLLLFTVTPWHDPHGVQGSLDAAFANQFDGLQRLVLSLLRSVPQIQSLRVDSVALEDLSYALTMAPVGFPNDDIQQHIYTLSQEVDTVAALMQRLYVEVDVFIHLATATSHTFGKVLERRPHGFARYVCQKLQFCIFVRRQDIIQLHLTLQNHLDILSNAIESPALLAKTLSEACQHLQLYADTVVSTVALRTNVPIGQGCLPLLMLWNLSDPDGQEFSTSSRNVGALQTFCVCLVHIERQVNDDIASIRSLQETLTVLRRIQLTGIFIEPSLPKRLYQKIDAILSLRLAGGKENRLRLPSGFESHLHMPSAG